MENTFIATKSGGTVNRKKYYGYKQLPEVICDPVLSIPEPFSVEFAPNRLWAIEKM